MKGSDHLPPDINKYDICLLFPMESKTNNLNDLRLDTIQRISTIVGEDYIYLFYNYKQKKVHMFVRASLRLIKIKAEEEKFQLLLDSENGKQYAYDGNEAALVNGFQIPHLNEVTIIEPFDYIYVDYVRKPELQKLYYVPEGMTHPFRKSIRIKLLSAILASCTTEKTYEGELAIDHLYQSRIITNCYPLHDGKDLDFFSDEWNNIFAIFPWNQPFNELKDYFGEKLSFYFFYLGFLGYWLMFPVIIGIAFQAIMIINWKKGDVPESPVFALFISLWLITLARFWSRIEQITAMKWNMVGYTEKTELADKMRFYFYGTYIKSYIDGDDLLYFRSSKRKGLYFVSCFFCFILIIICLSTVAMIFYLRDVIHNSDTVLKNYSKWIIAALISLQITIINKFIYQISLCLTSMENHRTDANFDYAQVLKITILQSINAFSSLYYLAFAARYVPYAYPRAIYKALHLENPVGGCGTMKNLCMQSLAIHLLVIISTQTLGSVTWNFFIPAILRYCYRELVPCCISCLYTCFCAPREDYYYANAEPIEFDICQYNPCSYSYSCCQTTNPTSSAANQHHDDDSSKSSNAIQGNYPEETNSQIAGVNPATSGKAPGGGSMLVSDINTNDNKSTIETDDMQIKKKESLSKFKNNGNIESFDIDSEDDSTDDGDLHEPSEKKKEKKNNFLIMPTNARKKSQFIENNDKQPHPVSTAPLYSQDNSMNSLPMDQQPAMQRIPTLHGDKAINNNHSNNNNVDDEDERNSSVSSNDSHNQHAITMRSNNNHTNLHSENDNYIFNYNLDSRYGFFDQNHSLQKGYARIILFFNLLTLFGSILPGAYLIVFLYILFEIKSCAWYLTYICHRPEPIEAEGIGNWNTVMNIFVSIVVITNGGLIAFAMDQFYSWPIQNKILLFLGKVSFCFIYKFTLKLTVAGKPSEVYIQQKRAKFINSKLILQEPDRIDENYALDLL